MRNFVIVLSFVLFIFASTGCSSPMEKVKEQYGKYLTTVHKPKLGLKGEVQVLVEEPLEFEHLAYIKVRNIDDLEVRAIRSIKKHARDGFYVAPLYKGDFEDQEMLLEIFTERQAVREFWHIKKDQGSVKLHVPNWPLPSGQTMRQHIDLARLK